MALSLQRFTKSEPHTGLNGILRKRMQEEREKYKNVEASDKVVNGDVLSEVLIIEILSWLPVKALLQFKSVCKLWYGIISSPNFISKHLKNYYEHQHNDHNSTCLLAQLEDIHDLIKFQLFELLVARESETPLRILGQELLSKMPMYGSRVFGPCHGLYYLFDLDSGKRALWNPALNELKVLPPNTIRVCHSVHIPPALVKEPASIYEPYLLYTTSGVGDVSGFGYDALTDDYKVVVIKSFQRSIRISETNNEEFSIGGRTSSFFVYSLKKDAWNYCGDLAGFRTVFPSHSEYTFVNGCYYWLGFNDDWLGLHESREVVVCFDMSANRFYEILAPKEDRCLLRLAVDQDDVAIVIGSGYLWTLNQGLWTKKNIKDLGVNSPIRSWMFKFVLECKGGQILYDPGPQVLNDLASREGFVILDVFPFKESLVSVGGTKISNEEVESGTLNSVGSSQLSTVINPDNW